MSNLHPLATILAPYAPPREPVSRFHIFAATDPEHDWLGTVSSREALTRALKNLPQAECVIQRDCDGVVTDITEDVLS